MTYSNDDSRRKLNDKEDSADPLLKFRVQTAELMLADLGARLSMLEGVVFALKPEFMKSESLRGSRSISMGSEQFARNGKSRTA